VVRQLGWKNVRKLHFDNVFNNFRDLRGHRGLAGRRRRKFHISHEHSIRGVVGECGKVEGRDKDFRWAMFGTGESTTGPVYCLVVDGGEYNLIRSPVDHRVNLSQPGFAQYKIVFAEGIDDGVNVIEVFVTIEKNGSSVVCKRRSAIGEKYRNRSGILQCDVIIGMTEGRADDIALCTPIDKNTCRLTVDVSGEGQELFFEFV